MLHLKFIASNTRPFSSTAIYRQLNFAVLKTVEFCPTSGEVAKPQFLESPQGFLKIRQNSYQ